ncbi:DUF5615 family PIN-like protein [candidate division KSB1 bacterium]|nr:DUF5615 family PIN-like protein [candidate division KSB1 bacterium]
MAKYIVDANLPYYFNLWNNDDFIHVFDIKEMMTDEELWDYAKTNQLTIITKDADFSVKTLYVGPPRVIHLKIGNLKINDLFKFLNDNWENIKNISNSHKLTNVYTDRIEGLE